MRTDGRLTEAASPRCPRLKRATCTADSWCTSAAPMASGAMSRTSSPRPRDGNTRLDADAAEAKRCIADSGAPVGEAEIRGGEDDGTRSADVGDRVEAS